MKAIKIHKQGGAEVMQYEDITLEAPERGEVRLRHTAIGLSIVREITDAIQFAPHLDPLPRYSLRGGGEETMDSYFPHDA